MPTPTGLSSATAVVNSGNVLIDGLLDDYRWTGGQFSYSFPTVGSLWSTDPNSGYGPSTGDGEPWNGFAALSASQQSTVTAVLNSAASFADLSITRVTETSQSVGDLRIGFSSNAGGGYAAAYLPGPAAASGDVWFDTEGQMATASWAPGEYNYMTVLHELGHALGLSHPFDQGDGSPSFGSPWDSRSYTVMSYSALAGDQNTLFSFNPTTYMLLDIQALQYLYGANTADHAGDDTYTFNGTGDYHQTLWDGGGTDTIVYASSVGGTIDLRDGEGSTLGNAVSIFDTMGQTLVASVRNVWIAYDALIENATGGTGNDTLLGNAAANVLNGGAGADKMTGGDGADTYYIDVAGDVVTETNANASTGGIDLVRSTISYTLGANLENLRIASGGTVNGTGNSLANVLYANNGNNVLDGSSGIDTVSYVYAASAVTVSLATTASQATGGSGSDKLLNTENLTGSNYNDTLSGNAAANMLNGGTGADRMTGGDGSDVYTVDNAGDVVAESNPTASSGGTDLVNSTISFTLGGNVENLRITAGGTVNGTGNTLANLLYAGAGNNVLNAGSGTDTVSYAYATGAVSASLAITVAQATGSSGSDTLLGAENLNGGNYNDTLTGNASANALNGAAGADRMTGGDGSDTYFVDNVGDVVVENNASVSPGGTDLVNASVTWTLASNVENLTLTGSAVINGSGNTLANTLVGNASNNVLIGGSGADRMTGGDGSDTYSVDNAGDVVTESNATTTTGGIDVVNTSISYTLVANVESLRITAGGSVNGTGNSLANTFYAGAGNNVLNGSTGTDTVSYLYASATVSANLALTVAQTTGGSGSDTFVGIENLTGSNYNDTLTGNSAANTLNGGSGNDNLNGGAGNDILVGAAGNDNFVFSSALSASSNKDAVSDFASGTDRMSFDNAVFTTIGANGALSSAAFYVGGAAHDSSDRLIYDKAAGNLYYDADGTGAAVKILFASVIANTSIALGDLWVS